MFQDKWLITGNAYWAFLSFQQKEETFHVTCKNVGFEIKKRRRRKNNGVTLTPYSTSGVGQEQKAQACVDSYIRIVFDHREQGHLAQVGVYVF